MTKPKKPEDWPLKALLENAISRRAFVMAFVRKLDLSVTLSVRQGREWEGTLTLAAESPNVCEAVLLAGATVPSGSFEGTPRASLFLDEERLRAAVTKDRIGFWPLQGPGVVYSGYRATEAFAQLKAGTERAAADVERGSWLGYFATRDTELKLRANVKGKCEARLVAALYSTMEGK